MPAHTPNLSMASLQPVQQATCTAPTPERWLGKKSNDQIAKVHTDLVGDRRACERTGTCKCCNAHVCGEDAARANAFRGAANSSCAQILHASSVVAT